MRRDEFYILNNLYEASKGKARNKREVGITKALRSKKTFANLVAQKYIDEKTGMMTEKGRTALEPFRVKSAVILAAGSATRFIPLSLEQPKGLYEVKGEKLIERQIQQLHEAGIRDISIVLGYKKDMFAYLADKYQVRLLFNPAYNSKNNIESILVAADYLSDSYICVCDSYFVENPFHCFEYQSFYAGYLTEEKKEEMYAQIDHTGRILSMEKGEDGGLMLLGHTFWRREFSEKFIELAMMHREDGLYDDKFWEWLVRDYLSVFPPFYFKEYLPDSIFEFDYFEQLRAFDTGYLNHAHSDIIRNIKLVFRCDEEDIVDFRTVKEGLTNTSFIFKINGTDYIYRHPGDGTENIINRRNEKNSLILAKEYGIDPTYIYMDVNEGWKISEYIPMFRMPDYSKFEDSLLVIQVMKKLHKLPVNVSYGLKPWEDAEKIEQLLKKKNHHCFDGYEYLKTKVKRLYQRTINDGVQKCFCHGDTYKPNWMIQPEGNVILIDWEYAGQSDPGIDVGYYIVDAMYDFDEARRFIKAYLSDKWSEILEFHYMAYVAIIAYYWFVWALYRESCGASIKESLKNWHDMAEKYAGFLNEKAF